jgi:hypothetical protein
MFTNALLSIVLGVLGVFQCNAADLKSHITGGAQPMMSYADRGYWLLYDGRDRSDWDSGSCYIGEPWLEFYFDAMYEFSQISILNRGESCCYERTNGVEVKVCKGSGGANCESCGTIENAGQGDWINLDCPSGEVGDVVRLEESDGDLINLCEINVKGERVSDLATDLTSQITGGDQSGVLASYTDHTKMYDGGITALYSDKSCFNAGYDVGPPFWGEVSFDKDYYFTTLSALNRKDECCGDRGNEVLFEVCKDNDCTVCGKYGEAPAGQWISVQCPENTVGDTIRFTKDTSDGITINICEVKIWGSETPILSSGKQDSGLEPIDSNSYSDCDADCDDYHRHCDDITSKKALDEEGEDFFNGHERSCEDAYISSRCPRTCSLCSPCIDSLEEKVDDMVDLLNQLV